MFQLEKTTQAICTNANPRREFHGKELVRAIDLTFQIKGENTLLDLIEKGLREHHYTNHALTAGQETVPGVVIPLPNLRFPKLPLEYRYGEQKTRGYRWVWDWGTQDAHADFTDAVVHGIQYEIQEGGSSSVKFTVTYNGDELADNDLYGELCGMPAMGEVWITLFAPPELMAVKKGYRAGKADSSQVKPDPEQPELPEGDDADDENTPTGAFIAAGGLVVTH
jgi:hypothetical protein